MVFNGTPISGATNQTHYGTATGNYYAELLMETVAA
jgi:hypothetical protein